ncbi:ankyrin repeat-containing domain protein [Mycena floridula]|nr:ankyrin repeat-containing domain protein [Mycena floridula]KAJ7577238.1 ankyrin repeat-containing domain protein [Mycena floridula]
MAIRSHHVDLVHLLLQHPNIQPGLASGRGWTPLMYACQFKNLGIVLISHEKTIPPNFIYEAGQSELHIAVATGNVDIVQLLLPHPNIQPGLKDVNGCTPLMIAHSNQNSEIAKLLLEHSYYTGQSTQ